MIEKAKRYTDIEKAEFIAFVGWLLINEPNDFIVKRTNLEDDERYVINIYRKTSEGTTLYCWFFDGYIDFVEEDDSEDAWFGFQMDVPFFDDVSIPDYVPYVIID